MRWSTAICAGGEASAVEPCFPAHQRKSTRTPAYQVRGSGIVPVL